MTRALVHRLQADGHEVKVATKHHIGGQLVVDGIHCFDGIEYGLTNKIVEEEGYDYIISAMDDWVLPEPLKKWVSIVFLDCEYIFPKLINILKGAKYQIAVTEHAKRELEKVGFQPLYAPLGIETKTFHPDSDLRKSYREKKGWDDKTFVIGLVGINYATDRKNIIGTIRAFQAFHKKHPNSVLYLHTDVMGSATQGLPLGWVMNACGFEALGKGPVQYADQKRYHLWDIAPEELAACYNSFDVMCLPSQGEGFGYPWLEAQACGCPVISVDTTSGKQLNMSGWLIPANDDYFEYSTHLSWFVKAPASAIWRKLELAYKVWENGSIVKYREKAVKRASEYDWDIVYPKYWKPILEILQNKKTEVRRLPDYGTNIYENYPGKVTPVVECYEICKKTDCVKYKPDNFVLLQGEWKGPISVLNRSYPIIPDKNGNLLVSNTCSFHRWLSPRFIKECQKMWEELLSYPLIREEMNKLWDEKYFGREYISLDNAIKNRVVDDEYIKLWQTAFTTSFNFIPEILSLIPEKGKVLDVGAGNGRRVKELREKGYDTIGVDINKVWIDNDSVIYGDMCNLPFADNSFDFVYSIAVIEHLEDPLKGISELLRVSKDLVLVAATATEDWSYVEDPTHKVPWSAERWKRELSEFGDIIKAYNASTFLMKKRK